jgi:DedD protein
MEEGLKKRLIGAAVLASLAVIFVPMLFEEPPSRPPPLPPLPSRPPAQDFASQMLREEVPAVTPLAPRTVANETDTDGSENTGASAPPASEPRTGLSAWVIQVGSFSSRENAQNLVAKLRDAKMPTPDPELVDLRGKRYYRVKVGPVVERAEADGMLSRVNEITGAEARVQQYP